MANYTVSEFVIEMGFDPSKVERGLSQLDKRVMQVATHIEKQLNSAFTRLNGAQKTGEIFKQIQRQADQTSNHIQKALQRGFAVGGVGGGLFTRYQQEGVQAANTVRDAMREASRAAGAPAGNPRPYTPRVNNRLTGAESIRDLSHRQTTSSFFGNMQLRHPQLAQQYQNRLNELRNSSLMGNRDVTEFRRNLRNLNFEFSQQVRASSQARASQRLNALEGASLFGKLGVAVSTVTAGLLSLNAAVEYFNESLEEGNKRNQAKNMLSGAYGSDTKAITDAVNEYANKYGADKADAQQQAAQLRFTLPAQQFSNQDIVKLLETESVFAHQTGMTQEAVGRLNYAMQQIAASTHLMGQDWLQVVNASPALIKPLEKLTNTRSSRELRDKLKALSGGETAQLMVKAMENLNTETKATEKALNSLQTAQGRYSNAIKDGQEKFYMGFSDGFRALLGASTSIIEDNLPLFKALGDGLGGVFKTLSEGIYTLDNVILTVRAYYADFSDMWQEFFKGLPEPVQKTLTTIGDIFRTWVEGMLVTAALFGGAGVAKKGGGWLMRLLGLGGAAGAAEGAGTAALTVAGVPALPLVGSTLGMYLGMKAAGAEPGYLQKDEEGVPGVPAKNSRWNQFMEWANGALSGVAVNATAMSTLPVLTPSPAMPQSQNVKVSLSPIQFAPLTLNIPMPDGSTYTTTAQVVDMISGREASVMMSAQGLGGGWQSPGQNAGFSPSSLKR